MHCSTDACKSQSCNCKEVFCGGRMPGINEFKSSFVDALKLAFIFEKSVLPFSEYPYKSSMLLRKIVDDCDKAPGFILGRMVPQNL